MRCSMCGHESPPGSSFCLNCGSSLAAVMPPPAFGQTPPPTAGLPIICPVCRGENPIGMKFCRACGTGLTGSGPQVMPMQPMGGAPMMAPPPMMPYQPLGMTPQQMGVPIPPTLPPAQATLPPPGGPQIVPTASGVGAPRSSSATIACPRCGTLTPVNFAFCQACGLHMQGLQPTDPGAGVAPRPVSQVGSSPQVAPPPPPAPMPPAPLPAGIDPLLATIAADARPASMAAAGAAWGSAVLVNRDGSDGQRFALTGEYTIVGRAGADVAFDEDRFLGRQHARIERGADGSVKIHALDGLNGVFRKTDASVELGDGAVVLVGREVLRFERVEADEKVGNPLIRHGVALFGSPPREPWGRLLQIIPSGGYRDVRHLFTDEVVLGREEGDIVFKDDAFMSRRHAAINWDGKRALLTDLGSSNGTFIRVTGPSVLKHGDHVRMGDQLLRIEIGR